MRACMLFGIDGGISRGTDGRLHPAYLASRICRTGNQRARAFEKEKKKVYACKRHEKVWALDCNG